jgi:hypothetical protein
MCQALVTRRRKKRNTQSLDDICCGTSDRIFKTDRIGVGDTSVAQQERKIGEGCWGIRGNPQHLCVLCFTCSFVSQAHMCHKQSSRSFYLLL